MSDILKDLIEGGFIGQTLIATLVWGGIIVIMVMKNPVDDRLFDAGFIVLGYFFHVAQMAVSTRAKIGERRDKENCQENQP